jgi:glycosyltransferase involved in cell wall biosynthesis
MREKKTIKYNPFVSIICVTYNRRPFFSTFFQCIRNQDYPASRYEVIIVDDGSDKIKDLVLEANIPQVKYFEVAEKMTLGKKRNYSHTLIDKRSQFITYFDDDDYHHPSRISHAVEMLGKNPNALCAGASELYVYFKHVKEMYQFGPYGPNHATAGTFTFRRELLEKTRYEDDACLAEERFFLQGYTIPLVQLDPMKTILVVSHNHNTFDKKELLINKNPDTVKLSKKTPELFISNKNESRIRDFLLSDLDGILKTYEPGEIKHKPDVLEQIVKIKSERDRIQTDMNKQSQITINRPGEGSVVLSNEEIVKIITQQQEEIQRLSKILTDYQKLLSVNNIAIP